MVGGLIFGERDCSSGATFPAGAAHGWWGGGKVLAALAVATRLLFPHPVVYNLSISLCVQPYIQLVLLAGWSAATLKKKVVTFLHAKHSEKRY